MSDLANLIEAVMKGDLESVRAILDANDEIVNQLLSLPPSVAGVE